MVQPRRWNIVCSLLLCAILLTPNTLVAEQGAPPPPPQQTRTGSVPPPAVIARDASRPAPMSSVGAQQVVLPVPRYFWRHGCGPTAVGMVVGYWDTLGYSDLIPGDAHTQTDAVNQAIASGGARGASWPADRAQHYEDYASPEDYFPNLREDAVITAGRTPHPDNSIADFMGTSRSSWGEFYGWSSTADVGPAWIQYVNLKNSRYEPGFTQYYWDYLPELTWELVTSEIDQGRPLVAFVDTDGNGDVDHATPIVGYREDPQQYACWDTWNSSLRWENFAGVSPGTPWGIWSALTLTLAAPASVQPKQWLPYLGCGGR